MNDKFVSAPLFREGLLTHYQFTIRELFLLPAWIFSFELIESHSRNFIST